MSHRKRVRAQYLSIFIENIVAKENSENCIEK